MKKTGFLYDEKYLDHLTGAYHPENPERLRAIYHGIKAAGLLPKLRMIAAAVPDMEWIEMVHDKAYIERFKSVCLSGEKTFDYPDNQMCPQTFNVALLAVGGILKAVDMVMAGEIDNVFCAVRPPGHHAESDKAMGFCYFANAAIAAKYLTRKWSVERVGIIDFDVHHGNGTQHILEEEADVFYYSIHEHPSFSFPGTGRVFEKGTGPGTGYTRNYPVLPGEGDEAYIKIIRTDVIPTFDWYKPQVIILSAGFDAHTDDVLSGIKVTTAGFTRIMQMLSELAEKHAQGKIISILEGGYSLKRLPELVINHLKILLNEPLGPEGKKENESCL